MAKKGAVDLHGIDREFRKVLGKLQDAAKTAAGTERKQIEELARKLEGAHAQTLSLCPKIFSAWPAAPAKKGAPKRSRGRTR